MARETSHLPIDEDRAARIVQQALDQAERDLELLAQRYLAQGGDVHQQLVLEQMQQALDDLARQYGLSVVHGPWGQMLVEAAKLGAVSVEGASFVLSRAQLDVALWNEAIKIKGLVAEGAAVVQEIVTQSMIQGDSLQEISRAVQERVKVNGGVINRVRADMIARNELFSVYRQTSKKASDDSGVELFQMIGPMDSRTSAICAAHVGQVKSAAEWITIHKLVFVYGLHPNCRHTFDPVRNADSPAVKKLEEWGTKQRARLAEAA